MPTLLHSTRDRRRQAAIPHSGCDRSPVRQLWSLLRHPWRCGDTVGSCDDVQDVLGTAPTIVLPTPCTSLLLFLRRNPRTAWARPSSAVRTLTRSRPSPAGPSEHRHFKRRGWYPLQQPPRPPLELQGHRRDLRKAKDDTQDDCMPGASLSSAAQCTFYSSQIQRAS